MMNNTPKKYKKYTFINLFRAERLSDTRIDSHV